MDSSYLIDTVRGATVGIGFLVVLFGIIAVYLALPERIQAKLAIKDRRPATYKTPNALSRHLDGFLQGNGGWIAAFAAGAGLTFLIQGGESFWGGTLILGTA